MLTTPKSRRLFAANWADEAKRMVAQFRATHDLWAGDPAFQDLLARLRQGCSGFDGWWEAPDIRGVAAGRKSLSHPKRWRLRLEYASFQANDDPALKLMIYTAARVPAFLRTTDRRLKVVVREPIADCAVSIRPLSKRRTET